MAVVKQELERIADQQQHTAMPPTTPVPPTIPVRPIVIPEPQNKGGTRRNVIIGLIVVVVLGVIGLVASRPSPTTQPPSVTLSNYCSALKTGDYQSAYNDWSSFAQSQETEAQFASDHNVDITDCTVSNVNDTAGTGTITYIGSNGASVVVDYTLVDENGTWKINTAQTR